MNCRHCGTPLLHSFMDLGYAPPSNAYLGPDELYGPEIYYPLKTRVCHICWLVQTEDYTRPQDLFGKDYAYFSSISTGWLLHAAKYTGDITRRLQLTSASMVIEIASNDGYLLRNFVSAAIPCLGIEPTASTAKAAEQLGITVLQEFFGEDVGKRLAAGNQQADLIIGNNVYAHVPDINDFTRGLKALLKKNGTINLEFPHLLRLMESTQFDTIYHEHFSYLSLTAVVRIFKSVGLRIYDVEQLSTHGGSLRIYGCHDEDEKTTSEAMNAILKDERRRGLDSLAGYQYFQAEADRVKDELLMFLLEKKKERKTVVAYGAAAKGNTLLNYAGVKPDLLPFVCDAATSKQGMFMPGSHIPILAPSALLERPPDFLLILPWNIAAEVYAQNQELSRRGTRFVTAVPKLEIM